ncbi:HAMP domain-containing sensor histidine kinase [Streptomyces sp. NPDC005761]|uniref:sensor histidine kinase n=1 Tax=unclassified Streptomyces TaxID=2593676 RepID=UPI0033C55FC9
MTFRLRALGLLLLVAVVATVATAWLTLRLATGQVEESVSASRSDTARITEELRDYGFSHGTWTGVEDVVRRLSEGTGQRIQAGTGDGVLLADSDVLAGRKPRPASEQPPVVIDAQPELRFPPGDGPGLALVKQTVTAMGRYRATAARTACLTGAGATVTATGDGMGLPRVVADRRVPHCDDAADDPNPLSTPDHDAAAGCLEEKGRQDLQHCLQRAFATRTAAVAPDELQVRLGTRNEAPPTFDVMPVAGVAGGVVLVVVAGALLLGRTVLRPIRALTSAARGLGEGDLAHRVPVAGRDEIAGLGRSFNRMADSLQEAEKRQRRLTGDIAHELRTPLANLRGYLEALQDGLVEPTPELLASLHEEAMLQQRIVDDLQDLALAEAGALTYHRTRIELGEVLRACRTAHRARAEEAGVQLAAHGDGPVPVEADAHRLRQVVGNLVSNAVRATGSGGTVTISSECRDGAAVIEVRDTGSGITAGELPYVFDRFWRADAARGRQTGGSGLGLAIVRQIVTDHGGSVEVESAVGVGTVFTVRLPIAPGD